MDNLARMLRGSISRYADRAAIQYKKDDRWIDVSYKDLGSKVGSLRSFLAKSGVRKGDRVAIILENGPEWPLIFFASVSIGAIVVPINPGSTEKEIETLLKDSECKIVFNKEYIEKMVEKMGTVPEGDCPHSIDIETDISPSDAACILYTSGTTDRPKGVVLSHENLLSNVDALRQSNIFTDRDSVFSILPLHHIYPLTVTMLLPLISGGKIIYPGTIRTEALLDAMRETNPTFFVAVPQVFYMFHKNIAQALKRVPWPFSILFRAMIRSLYRIRMATGINLSRYLLWGLHKKFGKRLRLFVSGGAKLDEDVEDALFELGFTILEGYGLTETAPVLTMPPLKKPKIGSVGLPIRGIRLKIADPGPDGVGEVVASGPNIMAGYYKRDDLTKEVIIDGWFHTGDLGYLDKDGYLFLTGRLKEVIVLSSGLNIYPDEIEDVYSKKAPVKEMCVFDLPAEKGREESTALWAVVVPDLEFFRKYGEVNLKHVIKERFDNVSRSLPPHKRLMGFYITLEGLPRTLLGKIKRFAVKEKYLPAALEEKGRVPEKRELSEEDAELMKRESAEKIIGYLKGQFRVEHHIVPGDLLEMDLGIDSLGRIELASGLEKLFGVKIKDEVVGKAFTVKDLIIGVESLLRQGAQELSAEEKEALSGPGYWNALLQVKPMKENLEKIDLGPGPIVWLADFLFLLPFYFIFRIFYDLKVTGKENLPKAGPYIIYVNHSSYLDGFIAAVSMPKFPKLDMFFVGFRPYLNVPIIRNLIKIGRVIPLDFSTHFLEALRSSYHVLKNGRNLCLFPEGVRSLDGDIRDFKRGFGILTKVAGAKVVPLLIDGAYEAWPRTAKFPKPHPISVKIGKVVDAQTLEEEGSRIGAKDSYDAICLGAKNRLIELRGKK